MKKQLLLFLLLPFFSSAQDVGLSQYTHSPMLFNPGRLGDGSVRLEMHQRLQPTPLSPSEYFVTSVLSAQYPLAPKAHGPNWGSAGLTVLRNQQLEGLNTYGALAGLGYQLPVERHRFRVGMQVGVMQTQLGDNLTTANQYDQSLGVFDLSIPTGENDIRPSSNAYTTFGMGAQWSWLGEEGYERVFLGASLLNVNKPSISFLGNRSQAGSLPSNWNFTGGFMVFPHENIAISPNFRWLNRLGDNLIQVGSWVSYYSPAASGLLLNSILKFGGWYRDNHSFVFATDFQINHYRASFSYDIPVGGDAPIWLGNGALEFTLGFSIPHKIRSKPVEPVKHQAESLPYTSIAPRKEFLAVKIPPKSPRVDTSTALETYFEPIVLFNDNPPVGLSYADRNALRSLGELLRVYPQTSILIVSEARVFDAPAQNEEEALRLAGKIKGYLINSTDLRDQDIRIIYNQAIDNPVVLPEDSKNAPRLGIRIESDI